MHYVPLTYSPTDLMTTIVAVGLTCLGVTALLTLIMYRRYLREVPQEGYKGLRGKISSFLDFRISHIESLLKVFYLFSAVFLACLAAASFFILEDTVTAAILAAVILIPGQLLLRFAYEWMMVFVQTRNATAQMAALLQSQELTQTAEEIQETAVTEEKKEEKPAPAKKKNSSRKKKSSDKKKSNNVKA